jgi:hypothetical protein
MNHGHYNDATDSFLGAIKKGSYEACHSNPSKSEESMAISALRSISGNADDSLENLDPARQLPDWLKAKITLAADYMSVVRDYIVNGQEA